MINIILDITKIVVSVGILICLYRCIKKRGEIDDDILQSTLENFN